MKRVGGTAATSNTGQAKEGQESREREGEREEGAYVWYFYVHNSHIHIHTHVLYIKLIYRVLLKL